MIRVLGSLTHQESGTLPWNPVREKKQECGPNWVEKKMVLANTNVLMNTSALMTCGGAHSPCSGQECGQTGAGYLYHQASCATHRHYTYSQSTEQHCKNIALCLQPGTSAWAAHNTAWPLPGPVLHLHIMIARSNSAAVYISH